MPIYEFVDLESGAPAEAYFPMAEAPEIGSEVDVGGRRMRRVVSLNFQTSAKPTFYLPGAPSLPRARWDGHKWLPPQDEPWHPPTQKYDAKGRPVFESLKSREEFLARGEGTYAYGQD